MAIELGIAEYSVKTAIKKLKDLGLINVERKSIGYRNFYSINDEKIKDLMNKESYEEFVELQKETDNTSTNVNLRLGVVDVSFNSELKNNMGELKNYMGELKSTDSSTDTNISDVNTIVGELKTIPQRVENNITITNNTTNNKLTNNTYKNTSIADKRLTEIIELSEHNFHSEAKQKIFALIEDFGSIEEAIQLIYPNDISVLKKHLNYFSNILNTK
jgi:hypothetical protein